MKRAALVLAIAAMAPAGAAVQACAAGPAAAVSVVHADGRTVSRCVEIRPGVTTGVDLLRDAGFSVVTEEFAGTGSLVCAIDGVGRDFPRSSCVPPCPDGRCTFWAYLTRSADGSYTFSDVGASSRVLRPGDADAWVYGTHRIGSVERMPVLGDPCADGSALRRAGAAASFPAAGVIAFSVAVAFVAAAVRRMRRRRPA